MKKSELQQLIRETVSEVFNELREDISFSGGNAEECNESSPPNFPPALKKKLIKQYGDTPKAYATMWTLHKKMEEGHERVCEMWAAWENKEVNEEDGENKMSPTDDDYAVNQAVATPDEGGEEAGQNAEHDETDLSNPEEKEEVELAKQIKVLADKLLTMHGVEAGEEAAPEAPEGDEGEEAAPEEVDVAADEETPVTEVKAKKKKSSRKKTKKK